MYGTDTAKYFSEKYMYIKDTDSKKLVFEQNKDISITYRADTSTAFLHFLPVQ